MSTIFFSYSHKDEALRDRLEVHLSTLKRQGIIEAWHDRRITAGDEFAGKIATELERADIILLLVSPDFLNSDYCYDVEMKRAMERHEAKEARVIPVILHHCDWHAAPFGMLLAAPKDGKPIVSWTDLNEAFLNVVQMLRAALPKSETKRATPTKDLTAPTVSATGPRSSNLRLKRTFSDLDRDRFIEEAFAYMLSFFETSMNELKARNDSIDTSVSRLDANRFTGTIYRDGKAISRCKVTLGGPMGKGISYSYNDRIDENSMNENLNVECDDQGLYLKALDMARFGSDKDTHLTFEGAAEYYWSLFIRPLQ